jgi:hypothetical protein
VKKNGRIYRGPNISCRRGSERDKIIVVQRIWACRMKCWTIGEVWQRGVAPLRGVAARCRLDSSSCHQSTLSMNPGLRRRPFPISVPESRFVDDSVTAVQGESGGFLMSL